VIRYKIKNKNYKQKTMVQPESIDLTINETNDKENCSKQPTENCAKLLTSASGVAKDDKKKTLLHKNEDGDTLFSPPKKKLKQESLPFPKISKQEALKQVEQVKSTEVSNEAIKSSTKTTVETSSSDGHQPMNAATLTSPATSAVSKIIPKTPVLETHADERPSNKTPLPKTPVANTPVDKTPLISPSVANTPVDKTPIAITPLVKTPLVSPTVDKTPVSTSKTEKKTSPLSSVEKLKLKEQRELQKQQKQQRLKEMEERKKKKEEEKQKREQERLMKQADKDKRELERKEKERLREEDRKKKEEERKVKEMEKKKRDEEKELEKEKREAEREKKELERKQEEDKKRIEEEAIKKKQQKMSSNFKNFFTKKTSQKAKKEVEEETYQRFHPFQLKPHMMLAPLNRKKDFKKEHLDIFLDKENLDAKTYIECLKSQTLRIKYITRRQLRKEEHVKQAEKQQKEPRAEKVVIVIDENSNSNETQDEDDDEDEEVLIKNQIKAKFLQFSENTRPAYFGTWTKSTNKITGRKIHGLDNDVFNYEIDSDEEWIDEPGEDLSDENVEEGEDKDDEETEDDQDGFFVPHGYLSDDEGVKDSDDDEDGNDENNDEMNSVKTKEQNADEREQEKLKAKLCSLETEFLKKKVKARKPLCIGVTFVNNIEKLHPLLREFAKCNLYQSIDEKKTVVSTGDDIEKWPVVKTNVTTDIDENACTPDYGRSTALTVPERAMPFLIKIIHGSSSNVNQIMETFQQYWAQYVKNMNLSFRSVVSKKQLRKKLQSIATRCHNKELGKICYTVNDEILEIYELKNTIKLGEGLPPLTESEIIVNENVVNIPLIMEDNLIADKTTTVVETYTKLNGESKEPEPMQID